MLLNMCWEDSEQEMLKRQKKRNCIKKKVKGFEKSAQVRLANIEATGQTHLSLAQSQAHQGLCVCISKSESNLLPLDACLFTRLPCLFSYISWLLQNIQFFSSHLIKRSLVVILLEVFYLQRADQKWPFLGCLSHSLMRPGPFSPCQCCRAGTGGDWGGAALLWASAAEGSANFLLQ